MTMLRETDPTDLLSHAEAVVLLRQIEAGLLAREARTSGRGHGDATDLELSRIEQVGAEARQHFIRANLGLVGMVAARYAARSQLNERELFQEGCIGLITALQRFDHARGLRFSTYALFWIRAFISAASAHSLGALNLPTSRAEQLRVARGVEVDLAQRLGRTPRAAEVAAALGRTESWTAELLAHQRPQSIDDLHPLDLEALGRTDDRDSYVDDPSVARRLLARLDALSRQVVELRLGFADGTPHSLAHTARTLRLPISKVRRLEERALDALRDVCPQQASVHL